MRRCIGLLALSMMLFGFAPLSASAERSPEDRFIYLINSERAKRGLNPLDARSDLNAIAENHSHRMHDRGQIYHNRNLGNEIRRKFHTGGENVGGGFDVDGLHAAFMDSPGHRRNILRPEYDEIGLGVVIDSSGEVYVTEVFLDVGKPTAAASKRKPERKSSPAKQPEKQEPRSEPSNSSAPPSSQSTSEQNPPKQQPKPSGQPNGPTVDRDRAVDLLVRIVSAG